MHMSTPEISKNRTRWSGGSSIQARLQSLRFYQLRLIHVLPDAYESLTSPCLRNNPWGKFPFVGFVAMFSAIGTLMMGALATGYHKRSELRKSQPVNSDEESDVHGENRPADHYVHGSAFMLESSNSSDLIRQRIIFQIISDTEGILSWNMHFLDKIYVGETKLPN
ncbi:hypothetical protein TIFTF001_025115 [Ficus carica]|uniref:Uncharacterized protein n=1 Tax=Ficus carica TaxID=3494 RepID=A0AA88AN80_FICCA|nr:hypothetical protein TIFTF001_025115 [Ficus carica]